MPPREVRWTWQSRHDDTRVGYMAMDGRVSLAELVRFMQEITPGTPLDEIQVNWATVVWTRPPTAEELAERRAAEARHAAKLEAWERETLARLAAKYGKDDL